MVAAFFGDEAARQLDDVAPHDRRHQRSGMERLGEKSQTAKGVIDACEVFFQMAADFRRRLQARQHVDKTEQGDAQRLVFERPVDHAAQQILGFEERRLVLGRFLIKRARQPLDFRFNCVDGESFACHDL